MKTQASIDVAYGTRRHRFASTDLDLGDLSSKIDVKRAVERALGLHEGALAGHGVLRWGRTTWIRLPLATRWRLFRARVDGRLLACGRALGRRVVAIVRVVLWALSLPFELVHEIFRRCMRLPLSLLETLFGCLGRLLRRGFGAVERGLRDGADIAVVVLGGVIALCRFLVMACLVVGLWPLLALGAVYFCVVVPVVQAVRGVVRLVEAGLRSVATWARGGLRFVLIAVRRAAVRVMRAVCMSRPVRLVRMGVGTIAAWLRFVVSTIAASLRGAQHRVGRSLRRGVRRVQAIVLIARDWVFGGVDTLLTGRTAEERERDHRVAVFEALLTSPRRRLDALYPVHAALEARDPRFYVQLAAWYARRGEGRDHLETFVGVLITSALAAHRSVGLALLRDLPPYEVGRVVDFIRGRVVRCGGRTERIGLFLNAPRALRTEVMRYLREREAVPAAFDGAVLAARETLKRLYGTLHIRPSARAQSILFHGRPPADSRLAAVRAIREASSEEERAALVRQHRIPYRVAATLLPSGEVAALLERMSPAEVINHMSLLQRRGALDDPALRARVEARLLDAVDDHRVSTFKPAGVSVDEAWTARLRRVTEARIRKHGRLRQPTALLVDASASMTQALALGRRIAVMLGVAARNPDGDAALHVYAFNDVATRVQAAGDDLEAWVRAFDAVAPRGPTSAGAGVVALLRDAVQVDQIVIISDQRENQRPRLLPALRLYRRAMRRAADLRVVFVNLGDATDDLERACRRLRMEVSSWRFEGDDQSLPDLLPLLVAPTRTELMLEIMSTPLPQRRDH